MRILSARFQHLVLRSSPTLLISAAGKVGRLEACTAWLPPEAVQLDAQQPEAAAVAAPDAQPEAVVAAEPVAQPEAVAVVAELCAQQAAVVAAEPCAQEAAAVVAAQGAQPQAALRQPEPSVVAAQAEAARLWFPGRPASAPGQESPMVSATAKAAVVHQIQAAAARLWIPG